MSENVKRFSSFSLCCVFVVACCVFCFVAPFEQKNVTEFLAGASLEEGNS